MAKKAAKKPGPKNRTQRVARRDQVAKMRLEGRTIREIALALDCSPATVHVDLRVIEQAWVTEAALSFATKAREKEADFIRVRNTAWDAYYESCSEDRPCGDPRFLELARRCDENIVKLYKLDDAEAFGKNEMAGGNVTDHQRVEAVEVVVESREQVNELMDFERFKSLAAKGA